MKRRETKGGYEDKLSGRVPDPKRLSAVSRSPLVRAGSRWLTFARGLSRWRSTSTADPLAFIESLYGGKFKTVEGGAFSLDKVYRTAGGGLFVSETRLNVSVHPRFDLRLLHVTGGRVGARARHITNSNVVAPSLTVQTWNVLPAAGERVPPAFGYVAVRGRRAQQSEEVESTRHAVRIEHLVREVASAGTSTHTSRPTVAPASLRLTSLDLRQFVTRTLRQEFVSLLLNTYLPAAVSREFLSVRTFGGSSAASAGGATAQVIAERHYASASGVASHRPAAWTYAEPSPRRTRNGGVEIRNELRSFETAKGHATVLDPRPPLSHLLPPASLLLSLSESFLTLSAGAAGRTTDQPGKRAAAPSLQLLRARAAQSAAREAAAVDAPSPSAQTPRLRAAVTRELLSSLNTFVERIHSTGTGITHAGGSTIFTRPGFDATLRRGLGQVSARQKGTFSNAPNHTTSINLIGRSVEFVHLASAAEFEREISTHDAGTRLLLERGPGVFATQGAPGAGTFLFATRLLRRTSGAANAAALSPAAATSMRLAAAAETESAVKETRAARPEGLALELIRHRREQVLQLPQPGYVFTQPARAQLEERQVITKASREEIVEVVRKEVRSLAAGANAVRAPSPVELAGLADEVYSTLVRRLLIEKERLGRF